MSVIEITYFSDVLCVWAYVSQARVNATKDKFRDAIRIEHRFCSVFGDTDGKITSTWKHKGGYEGFNAHLRQVADRFPHIEVHPDIWLEVRPPSSASAHLFMKAVRQWDHESVPTGRSTTSIFDQVMWSFRCAFFRDCRDISSWDTQCEIAQAHGADIGAIEKRRADDQKSVQAWQPHPFLDQRERVASMIKSPLKRFLARARVPTRQQPRERRHSPTWECQSR